MSIATPALTNFTAGEISPRLEGRVDLSKYFNGCRTLENFHVHPHGGATRRSGFRFVTPALDPAGPCLLIPFEFNSSQTYMLEFAEPEAGAGKIRVFTGHGAVTKDGDEYLVDHPYAATELDEVRYAQSADVLVLVHADHPPRTLTRLDHDDWVLEEMEFLGTPEAWTEGNYPSAVCFYEQRLVLAATPAEPGTLWFSRTGAHTDFRLKTREVPLSGWRDREIEDGNSDSLRTGAAGDTFQLLDGDGFEAQDAIKGQHPDGTTRYFRYKGAANLVASGADKTITFSDDPSGNQIESVFDAADEVNGDYWEMFEVGDRTEAGAGDEPLDDDGMEVTLSGSQANAVEFLVPKSRLWVGTAGGEWTITGSGVADAVTPEGVKASHEGTSGASKARPEAVGYATLFIQRAGKKIREMSYRYETDAYVSKDLTLLSEHITETGIRQLAYVQEPDSILYCLRNDGNLVTLTYVPDQDVMAWGRLATDGAVKAIASVYNDAEKRDELWAVVERQSQAGVQRYVEFLEGPFSGQPEEAFFVDSGLSYHGDPTTTLTGLDHLAGRTVSVLANGAVHTDAQVDEAGAITLNTPASTVHAGLPYTSTLQPMRLEAGSRRGTAQTKRKRILRVAVRFHQTLGGKIGCPGQTMEPIYFRSSADPMNTAPEPWSGDKVVNFPRGWDRDGLLTVIQSQPLPMTVLLIVPELVINE